MLYLAYGSNLSHEQMKKRCPRAEPLRPLHLTEAKLVFRGVADLTLEKGSVAPGGLWKITDQCERALDSYEGLASKLYIKRYLPVLHKGVTQDCVIYQMATHRGIMPPSEAYIEIIAQGYRDFGLDLAYLDEALNDAWGRKKVTPFLEERYNRRGRPKLAAPGN